MTEGPGAQRAPIHHQSPIHDYYPCCPHCEHGPQMPADEHTIPCGNPGCPGASPREGSMP